MLSLLLSFAGWPGVLLGGGAILAVALTVFLTWRSRIRARGVAAERARQAAVDEKAVNTYYGVRDVTEGLSDAELDALNADWVRHPPKL